MAAAVHGHSRSKRNASRASFAPGFYRALNASDDPSIPSNHTSLCLSHSSCDSDSGLPSNCYLVDRVVATRNYKGKRWYSILWDGYPKEEASWVDSEDVIPAAIRSFESPTSNHRLITDCISDFKAAIYKSLKSGIIITVIDLI